MKQHGTKIIVELPGVEPGSKQTANKFSTCLSRYWFSYTGRHQATYLYLSLLFSRPVTETYTRPALPFMCPLIRRRKAW